MNDNSEPDFPDLAPEEKQKVSTLSRRINEVMNDGVKDGLADLQVIGATMSAFMFFIANNVDPVEGLMVIGGATQAMREIAARRAFPGDFPGVFGADEGDEDIEQTADLATARPAGNA